MASSSITGEWIPVGESVYHRIELYGKDWYSEVKSAAKWLVPAPYGGPIVTVDEDFSPAAALILVHRASGPEFSRWKWRNNNRIFDCGWTNEEKLAFVTEDGSVFVYDVWGELIKNFNMGAEAKDLKIVDCRIFSSGTTTGIAVLTSAHRFFVVSSVLDPRVRKISSDLDSSRRWAVMAYERAPKIVVVGGGNGGITEISMLSPNANSASSIIDIGGTPRSRVVVVDARVSFDNTHLALIFDSGLIWLGRVTNDRLVKLTHCQLENAITSVNSVAWVANDCVVCFSKDTAMAYIVTTTGETDGFFLMDFVTSVQEVDGLRIFSQSGGQELFQMVPKIVEETFKIGSMAPSAMLHLAADEFYNKSHRADEYLRLVMPQLNAAVHQCITSAGFMFDSYYQKSLMKSAQFGKSFCSTSGSSSSSADLFAKMCKTLRVLNALRDCRIGIPLTISQYEELTPPVVIDRLLFRRLYPLAIAICQLLNLPAKSGQNRVLAHWACYKVSSKTEDDNTIAFDIAKRLGNHPSISYCDIAAKASEYGKKDLAIKLLEHEIRVEQQIPLLMKLGQESNALVKALATGDQDLAFTVIFSLKKKLSSSDFHMLIRKYPLGKVIYQSYCQQYDQDALDDWYSQEDDFLSQAKQAYHKAWESLRPETRVVMLMQSHELFRKCRSNPEYAGFVDESTKLLKFQSNLEDKFGRPFIGTSMNSTLSELIQMGETKSAEKIKSEFKVPDRRFCWIKIRALAQSCQWPELKNYAKQKKLPVSVTSLLKVVREFGGEEQVNSFLADNLLNQQERFNVLTEFGMYLDAAAAAFSSKNMEALNRLEAMVKLDDNNEILQKISAYKAKLVGKL